MADTRTLFLNALVAEFTVYAQQLKMAHWNITGPNFIELHTFFWDKYEEAIDSIDSLAEQVRKIGGFPDGTLTKYLSVSKIKEQESTNPEEILQIILRSAQRLDSNLDKAIRGTTMDLVTQNLFIEIKALMDKDIWFLKSMCPCNNSIDLEIKSVEWSPSSER